jgi:hypothetical protein
MNIDKKEVVFTVYKVLSIGKSSIWTSLFITSIITSVINRSINCILVITFALNKKGFMYHENININVSNMSKLNLVNFFEKKCIINKT